MQLISDGFIGNKASVGVLGNMAASMFTYMGAKTSLEQSIPSLIDYISPPKTEQEQNEILIQKLTAWSTHMAAGAF